MPTPPSRYRPDAPPDYSHRFHAGNVGDVWKHCVLVEVLRRADSDGRRVSYLDTHAGQGRYPLAATGEWTEGIGRLWSVETARDDAVSRYLALCRRLCPDAPRPLGYPGSPLLARATLGPTGALALWERDPATHDQLARELEAAPGARLFCGDGLVALASEVRVAEAHADAVIVLVDPPYSQKADWTQVPDAVAGAAAASRFASFVLWYPVKSLTRPNAMIARLRAAGVSGTIAELITTPLEHQRQRLNGSGVVLVRPPEGVLPALAAALPELGARCATRTGAWSARVVSW